MQRDYVFDATQHQPDQGVEPVPADWYNVLVEKVEINPFKESEGAQYVLWYKILDGTYMGKSIRHGFNLWHTSPKTVDIAHKQLSAVSHATGVMRVDMNTGGHELVQAQLRVKVIVGSAGFNEVKKVEALAGAVAPVAGGAPAPMPQPGAAPAPAPALMPAPVPAVMPAPQPMAAPAPQMAPAPAAMPAPMPAAQPIQGGWGGQPAPAAQPLPAAAQPAAVVPQAQPGVAGAAPWAAPAQ
jgi:hypothetical protein